MEVARGATAIAEGQQRVLLLRCERAIAGDRIDELDHRVVLTREHPQHQQVQQRQQRLRSPLRLGPRVYSGIFPYPRGIVFDKFPDQLGDKRRSTLIQGLDEHNRLGNS